MNREDYTDIQDSTIFDTMEAQLESVGVGVVWFEKPEELPALIEGMINTLESCPEEEEDLQ